MFRFSIIDYVLVLNSILYNLLEENPEAETIFKNIESNIRNELGNKYQTIANDSMH